MLIHHCQSRSFASKRTYKSSVAAKKHNNDRSAKYCRSSSALTGFTFPFWYGRHHRFIIALGRAGEKSLDSSVIKVDYKTLLSRSYQIVVDQNSKTIVEYPYRTFAL